MRETSRRAEDRKQIVIFDRYPPSLLVGTILVLALSMLDAALTLILLSEGARELNPVMLYYLGHGPAAFLMVKYVLTVLSLLIIIIGNEVLVHRYRVCSKLLPLFAILFGSVVIWEFYLLSIVP